MPSIKRIKRTVHYYHLNFNFAEKSKDKQEECFLNLFRRITAMANPKSRDDNRYKTVGEKLLFINEIKFSSGQKTVEGKLLSVRKDLLPQIINTTNDLQRAIEVEESEGTVDTTHFIVDYSKKRKTLAIEFNQFGAKLNDFLFYVREIGRTDTGLQDIGWELVTTPDGLENTLARIRRISEISLKIIPDNTERIKEVGGVVSALVAASEHQRPEYYHIRTKYDYRSESGTTGGNYFFNSLSDFLSRDKNNAIFFQEVKVKAENAEANNKLETFDLLVDKVKTEHFVEKLPKFNALSSSHMFEEMYKGLEVKRDNIHKSYIQILKNEGETDFGEPIKDHDK